VPTVVQVSVIILASALLFLASAVLVTGGIVLALPSKVDL
jgi:hypothetical protein